jgi:exodeoxyribonuclease V alpha subunit
MTLIMYGFYGELEASQKLPTALLTALLSAETKPLKNTDEHSHLEKIYIEIRHITFRNEENGWTVCRAGLPPTKHETIVVGCWPAIYCGDFYYVYGTWGHHAQFGKQFKAERIIAAQPQNPSDMVKYLGIGEKTAEKIVKVFGRDTFTVLDKDPERLKIVPRLGRKNATRIIKAWQEKRKLGETMMFLHRHGIAGKQAQKLLKKYDDKVIDVISENPYQLIADLRGVGFLTADKIAASVGIAGDDPRRVREGILYQLDLAEEKGHCYLTHEQLRHSLATTLNLEPEAIAARLDEVLVSLSRDQRLVMEHEVPSANTLPLLYHRDLHTAENNVAEHLRRLRDSAFAFKGADAPSLARIEDWLQRFCEKTGLTLSPQQHESVIKAAQSKVFVLTGGPGVGKTTVAKLMIKLFQAMGKAISLAAPTGRAAQRLSSVTTIGAKTLHRLLEWSPREQQFSKNAENPLTGDVFILDEVSMVDIRMAECFLQALPSRSQLILIGDVDQLPAIGPGNFLYDVINSQVVPFIKLDTIFRQARTSQIIEVAHMINRGIIPSFAEANASWDCHFIKADSPEEIKKIIYELLKKTLPAAGYDAVSDVQILTPMNKGDLGSQQFNREMQELLNPIPKNPQEFKGKLYTLRPGDKVIQTVNNYDLGIFNGDIGYVQQARIKGNQVLVQFGDRFVTFNEEQATDLALAYAITIHKSQGSEFPVVILPTARSHFVMQQRNLIYTALTRAKKLAIFVGHFQALCYGIKNEVSTKRQTQLMHRLTHQPPHAQGETHVSA